MPKYKIRKKASLHSSFLVRTSSSSADLDPVHDASPEKVVPLDDNLSNHVPDHMKQYGVLTSNPLLKAVYYLDSVVPRSYRFPSANGKYIKVEELMVETRLSFYVPISYLEICVAEINEEIGAMKCLGELTGSHAVLRKERTSELQQILDKYKKRLLFLKQRFGAPYFKRSVDRTVENLDFVPINLHLQKIRVKNENVDAVELVGEAKTSSASLSSTSPWSEYNIFTVGATAQHPMGFKHGGLLALLTNANDGGKSKNSLPSTLRDIRLRRDKQTVEEELNRRIEQLTKQIKYQLEKLKILIKPRSSASDIYSGILSSSTDALTLLSQKICELTSCCESSSISRSQAALTRARPSYNPPKTVPLQTASGTKTATVNGTCASDEHGTSPEVLWEEQTMMVKSQLSEVVSSVHSYIATLEKEQATDISESSNELSSQAETLISSLIELIENLHHDARNALTFSSIFLSRDVVDLNLNFRRKSVFSHALSICTCGVATVITSSLNNQLKLQQYSEAGIFLQVESLVSTYGNEQGMLQDYAVGIFDLENVSFKCVRIADHRPSESTPTRKNSESSHFLPTFANCNDVLVVSLPFDDDSYDCLPQDLQRGKVIKVHPVLFNVGINEEQTLAERFGSTNLQEFLNAEALQRTMKYYDLVRDLCPDAISDSLVDAQSLFSSPTGKGPFKKNLSFDDAQTPRPRSERLPSEVPSSRSPEAHSRHLPGTSVDNPKSLVGQLKRLDAVLNTKKNKNVEILELAADICHRLNGIRITSCKSAKDRTAMSVTLEQARILTYQHGMSPSVFMEALNCMRSEGTRRENTLKNTGCRKYAFTSVQLITFPKLYRAPDGSYGKGDT